MSITTRTPKELLIRGRELIAQGWTQHVMRSKDGSCFCAMGAVHEAYMEQQSAPFEQPSFQEARNVLLKSLPVSRHGWSLFKSVPDFNDHGNTRHADVIALYDRAIASINEPSHA
jgi:hypothetical protein